MSQTNKLLSRSFLSLGEGFHLVSASCWLDKWTHCSHWAVPFSHQVRGLCLSSAFCFLTLHFLVLHLPSLEFQELHWTQQQNSVQSFCLEPWAYSGEDFNQGKEVCSSHPLGTSLVKNWVSGIWVRFDLVQGPCFGCQSACSTGLTSCLPRAANVIFCLSSHRTRVLGEEPLVLVCLNLLTSQPVLRKSDFSVQHPAALT